MTLPDTVALRGTTYGAIEAEELDSEAEEEVEMVITTVVDEELDSVDSITGSGDQVEVDRGARVEDGGVQVEVGVGVGVGVGRGRWVVVGSGAGAGSGSDFPPPLKCQLIWNTPAPGS